MQSIEGEPERLPSSYGTFIRVRTERSFVPVWMADWHLRWTCHTNWGTSARSPLSSR